METIIKQLDLALTECGKVIASNAREMKEYEAKFKTLSDLEATLKDKGQELDGREKKVKYVENVVEYSETVAEEAKKAKEDILLATKATKSLQVEKADFNSLKNKALKEIENGKIANQKQSDALIAERNAFEDKLKAYKAVKSVV